MDLQHIRAFVAVVQEGNLTRAASRLHLTQPAVSMQLKSFQENLGLKLLTRSGRGLMPTVDGYEILPLAERILAAVDSLQQRAGGMQNSIRGEIAVGTTLNPEVTRLGATLQRLVQAHPNIKTRLFHGMSGWVRQEVLAGRLDAGFYLGQLAQPDDEPVLHCVPLTTFVHYVVAPKGWREKVAGASWAQLARLPWIWAHPHSVHNRLMSSPFRLIGAQPHVVAEADTEASMLDMVRSGIGLALARDLVALREAQANGLILRQDLAMPTELSFIVLEQRRSEPMLAAVLAAVQAAFE